MSVGQKLRRKVGDFIPRCLQLRCRCSRTTLCGHLVNPKGTVESPGPREEEDDSFPTPCAWRGRSVVSKLRHGFTVDIYPFELAVRDKGDGSAVGRPERCGSTLGMLEGPRG